MDTQKWAKRKLNKEGHKITKTRKGVINYITESCNMFSAPELISNLDNLDRVSIYRTLDVLEKLDIIHRTLNKDGEQMYELHQPKNHHHHAICNECEKQKCIKCPVKEEELSNLNNYHHSISLSFTCNNCM